LAETQQFPATKGPTMACTRPAETYPSAHPVLTGLQSDIEDFP
jgi:hypothetical protein